MFVLDTSAFINGWRDHLPPTTFPGVWELIDAAMGDGRVLAPRAAYREIVKWDDDVAKWVKARKSKFIEADGAVQGMAGELYQRLYATESGVRNEADPWVIAEAKIRGMTVVTYEGRSFDGEPTKKWHKKMPGICNHEGVTCVTLPEALGALGGMFDIRRTEASEQ